MSACGSRADIPVLLHYALTGVLLDMEDQPTDL